MTGQIPLSPEMIERGANVIDDMDRGRLSECKTTDDLVRRVIDAVFKEVPLVNYGIGLALMSEDIERVVLLTPRHQTMVLVQTPGEPDSIDSEAHKAYVQFGAGGVLKSITLSKFGVGDG